MPEHARDCPECDGTSWRAASKAVGHFCCMDCGCEQHFDVETRYCHGCEKSYSVPDFFVQWQCLYCDHINEGKHGRPN